MRVASWVICWAMVGPEVSMTTAKKTTISATTIVSATRLRQPADPGESLACAMEHDREQNAGEGEEDRGPRVPQRRGDSEDDDHADGGPHRRYG